MDDKQIAEQILDPTSIDLSKQRHFLAAFFLSFLWGVFGVDRFYLGKIWTGILKFLTFGGFGVWALADLTTIISGGMRDKQGNELIDAVKYKKFASTTMLLFTLVAAITIFAISAVSVYIVTQMIQNGGFEKVISDFINQTLDLQKIQDMTINQNINM